MTSSRRHNSSGGRNAHVPWLRKFLAHGNGVAIVRAYTSSGWFHEWAIQAETMLFPRGKTRFIRPDGTIGAAPGHGVVLLGMGNVANTALEGSGLGLFIRLAGLPQVGSGACSSSGRHRRDVHYSNEGSAR